MEAAPIGISRVLFNQEQIAQRVAEMGRQIATDLSGEEPLFVCILRGAAIFHADLVRAVNLNLKIDFISVSSYGAATASSGQVQLLKDLESSIEKQHVVLVEDIVDTGLTATYLLRNLASRSPRSVRFCSLLSKPARREVEIEPDYLGFEIPDEFVVGYGLDFNQQFRNLPFIGVFDSDQLE